MQPLDEDWKLLLNLLPSGWEQQAVLSGASERLRGFPSTADLLRTLLLHVGKGYSLRETVVRAKAVGMAQVSDVALMKRLQKAEEWLRRLCVSLLQESGWEMPAETRGYNVRALDGTLVKEPGRRGSLWRIHYSIRIPNLVCDHLELTSLKGAGTGESLERFAASPGDLVLADRGFCRPGGIEALHRQGAAVMVRLNSSTLPLWNPEGSRFGLSEQISQLQETGTEQEWPVWVQGVPQRIAGRLCVLRKSAEATARARRRIARKAQQGGPQPKPETLQYAGYVMVFTTVPASHFSAAEVLEWYRVRWQIELVFKRLKTLAELGSLPKHDDQSARAWLYGKLLIALLGQKLERLGRDISPWGYRQPEAWQWQRVAGF
jgi:Transposase DDE domain